MASNSNNDLMLVTHADLMAMAEKLANASNNAFTKAGALNMIASSLLGPKHDWSRIKHANSMTTSQRARKQSAALSIETVAQDYGRGAALKMSAQRRPDGSIEIKTEDEHTVWVEFNDDCLKVHLYSNGSDGNVAIWSQPCHQPFVLDESWEDERYETASVAPVAGQDERKLLGWQVADPITGELWNDRPGYAILLLKLALEDYAEALEAGEARFTMVPIHEGAINEPTFMS